MCVPDRSIAIDVDEIPGRKRQRVEIADDLPRLRPREPAAASPMGNAVHARDAARLFSLERIEQFDECDLAFPGDDDVGAAVQLGRRMIARIGA